MWTAALSAIALSAACVCGYENSSPFFFHSTAQLNTRPVPKISSATAIEADIKALTSSCPTRNYLVISQPGVSPSDYSSPRNAPLLKQLLSTSSESATSRQIRDVIGTIDLSPVVAGLEKSCGTKGQLVDSHSLTIPDLGRSSKNKIIFTQLPALTAGLTVDERHVLLLQHDNFVSTMINQYFDNKDFTLIYTTTSQDAAGTDESVSEKTQYEADIPLADMMHSGELRRSLTKRKDKTTTNQTIVDGPLFDKYQFLSPGIFMGGLVGLILLSILYVGLSALSSLQVTYAAFDKEQGQLASKKQQ